MILRCNIVFPWNRYISSFVSFEKIQWATEINLEDAFPDEPVGQNTHFVSNLQTRLSTGFVQLANSSNQRENIYNQIDIFCWCCSSSSWGIHVSDRLTVKVWSPRVTWWPRSTGNGSLNRARRIPDLHLTRNTKQYHLVYLLIAHVLVMNIWGTTP